MPTWPTAALSHASFMTCAMRGRWQGWQRRSGAVVVAAFVAVSGCVEKEVLDPKVAIAVTGGSVLPDDCYGLGSGKQCHVLEVRVVNENEREDVDTNMFYWKAVSAQGGVFQSLRVEGPDAVAAGASGAVTLGFDVTDGSNLVQLRYKGLWMSNPVTASVPSYGDSGRGSGPSSPPTGEPASTPQPRSDSTRPRECPASASPPCPRAYYNASSLTNASWDVWALGLSQGVITSWGDEGRGGHEVHNVWKYGGLVYSLTPIFVAAAMDQKTGTKQRICYGVNEEMECKYLGRDSSIVFPAGSNTTLYWGGTTLPEGDHWVYAGKAALLVHVDSPPRIGSTVYVEGVGTATLLRATYNASERQAFAELKYVPVGISEFGAEGWTITGFDEIPEGRTYLLRGDREPLRLNMNGMTAWPFTWEFHCSSTQSEGSFDCA